MYVVTCAHVRVCMWRPKVISGYILRLLNILHIEAGSFVVPRAGCLPCIASQPALQICWLHLLSGLGFTDALHGFWGAKLNSRHISYRAMPKAHKVFLWIMKSNKMIHRILRNSTVSEIFYIKEIYL